jgi:hypothetical protein
VSAERATTRKPDRSKEKEKEKEKEEDAIEQM